MVTVPAIHRASRILDALARSGKPMAFGELAAVVDLPRSSLHNVCTSLLETGLLERDSSGRFRIGLRVVELARTQLAGTDLVNTFLAACRDRAPDLNETIVLAVRNGSDVVYVAFVNTDQPLAVRYQIGLRLPAACTASGKAILATLPDEQVVAIVGERPVSRLDPERTGPVEGLLADLRRTRERGYSVDDEDTARGMLCIGSPVFEGSDPLARGAIAVSMVKAAARASEAEVASDARALSREISRRLGARRPGC